jgi:isopenicillin N synthase-like dioxygenase
VGNESNTFDPLEKEHSLRAESQSWDTSTVVPARPDDIPLIDVSDYFATASDEDLDIAAEQLGYASRNVGFYSLIGHTVPDKTICDAFEQTRRFHQLPMEQKNALLMDQPDARIKGAGYRERSVYYQARSRHCAIGQSLAR